MSIYSPYQYEQDPHEGFGPIVIVFVLALIVVGIAAVKASFR